MSHAPAKKLSLSKETLRSLEAPVRPAPAGTSSILLSLFRICATSN